jgi:hypothetical protein
MIGKREEHVVREVVIRRWRAAPARMRAGVVLGVALGLAITAALAQTISVAPRNSVAATVDDANIPIWSFGAAGAVPEPNDPNTVQNDKLVLVGQEGINRTFDRVFRTIGALNGGSWSWTTPAFLSPPACDPNDPNNPVAPCIYHTQDPHVQYDPVSGNFLMVCRMFPGTEECDADQSKIKLGFASFWPIDPNTCEPNTSATAFSGGLRILTVPTEHFIHRPTLVRGRPLAGPAVSEWYILYEGNTGGYMKSYDGGCSWVGGAVPDAIGRLHGAVAPDGRIYAVESYAGARLFGLYMGEEGDVGVNWSLLKDGQHQAISIPVNTGQPLKYSALPAGYYGGTSIIGPQFDNPRPAADPYDPNTLYVVYYDLKQAVGGTPAADEDINVYLRVLTKSGASSWSLGSRIQVNDDPLGFIADDFQPEIFVTRASAQDSPVVHVVYYSDRRFPSQVDTDPNDPDDPNDPYNLNENAQFDLYYTWAEVGESVEFETPRLFSTKSPGDPNYADPTSDPAAIRYELIPPVVQTCAPSTTWVYELRPRFGLDIRRTPNAPDFKLVVVHPTTDQTTTGHKSTQSITFIDWDN